MHDWVSAARPVAQSVGSVQFGQPLLSRPMAAAREQVIELGQSGEAHPKYRPPLQKHWPPPMQVSGTQ